MFASFTSGFRNKPLKDYNWNFYSELIEKKDVIIPINPEGWKINVKARPQNQFFVFIENTIDRIKYDNTKTPDFGSLKGLC